MVENDLFRSLVWRRAPFLSILLLSVVAAAACSESDGASARLTEARSQPEATEQVVEDGTEQNEPPAPPPRPAEEDGQTTTLPTPACVAAFQAVATVDVDDPVAYDNAYLATTRRCSNYADWLATLHEYPETIGYRPTATPQQLDGELYLVCIPMTNTPVCNDADRLGLLD